MKSIKAHLDSINEKISEWGNIPMAHDSQNNLEALDQKADIWWNELRVEMEKLQKAIFGDE